MTVAPEVSLEDPFEHAAREYRKQREEAADLLDQASKIVARGRARGAHTSSKAANGFPFNDLDPEDAKQPARVEVNGQTHALSSNPTTSLATIALGRIAAGRLATSSRFWNSLVGRRLWEEHRFSSFVGATDHERMQKILLNETSEEFCVMVFNDLETDDAEIQSAFREAADWLRSSKPIGYVN